MTFAVCHRILREAARQTSAQERGRPDQRGRDDGTTGEGRRAAQDCRTTEAALCQRRSSRTDKKWSLCHLFSLSLRPFSVVAVTSHPPPPPWGANVASPRKCRVQTTRRCDVSTWVNITGDIQTCPNTYRPPHPLPSHGPRRRRRRRRR